MTKLRIVAASVALLTLGGVAGVMIPAHSQGSSTEEFKAGYPDRKEKTTPVDVNGDGNDESVGDMEVGHGPLYRGGKRIGNQQHVCTNVQASESSFAIHCDGTFTIKGRGKIEVAGTLIFGRREFRSTALSITGGTQEFRNASGAVIFGGSENRTNFTFKVVHN